MEWLCNARAARLAAAVLAVVTIAGCPELNQWSGPSPDPFFSVPDPIPESWNAQGKSRSVEPQSPDDEAVD
jgi:hypothetical protein